jgi:alkylhydroperoxidase/carboxymuconolactone decarboxylase family protein YurZ
MDARTRILVCLGSAAAANCVSCFHHFHAKAQAAGIGADEVREAVDLGAQVKHGAHVVLMEAVDSGMGKGGAGVGSCCCGSGSDCGT